MEEDIIVQTSAEEGNHVQKNLDIIPSVVTFKWIKTLSKLLLEQAIMFKNLDIIPSTVIFKWKKTSLSKLLLEEAIMYKNLDIIPSAVILKWKKTSLSKLLLEQAIMYKNLDSVLKSRMRRLLLLLVYDAAVWLL